MQEFVTHSREETVAVGRELAKTLPAGALIAFTGAQNTSTVTRAKGIAAARMKGILLPLGFFDRSDSVAIKGSVTASKMRQINEMTPRTVSAPNRTSPGMTYETAPLAISPAVGR